MSDEDREYVAEEVRKELDRLRDSFDEAEVSQDVNVINRYVRLVVENGTFMPEKRLEHESDLSFRERLSGKSSFRADLWLDLGLMLGAALERDVPSEDEEAVAAWIAGEYTLEADEE